MIYDAMLAFTRTSTSIPYDLDDSYWSTCHPVVFIGLHNTGYIQAIVSVLLLGLTLYMGAHMISQWPSEASLLTSGNMSFILATSHLEAAYENAMSDNFLSRYA